MRCGLHAWSLFLLAVLAVIILATIALIRSENEPRNAGLPMVETAP